MRISDCSADVCSSYLPRTAVHNICLGGPAGAPALPVATACRRRRLRYALALDQVAVFARDSAYRTPQRQPPGQGRARRLATPLLGTPGPGRDGPACARELHPHQSGEARSEEHTSELQSLMRISYDVFCLKKKKHKNPINI